MLATEAAWSVFLPCNHCRSAYANATSTNRGTIWTREGLTHKQRSLVVITLLSTMGKQNELSAHIKGALNNGLTEVEIRCASTSTKLCATCNDR